MVSEMAKLLKDGRRERITMKSKTNTAVFINQGFISKLICSYDKGGNPVSQDMAVIADHNDPTI